MNAADAKIEAEHCRQVIEDSGGLLELPVFFDMEDADSYKREHGFAFDPVEITEICRTFTSNLGLDCGVYASYSWLTDYIGWQSLGCAIWNAQYNIEDDFEGYMWQFTDALEISGKLFDGDILYQ